MMIGAEFAGASVVVTGAGSGIGAATAQLFGRLGAAVAVLDVRAAEAEDVASDIQRDEGLAVAYPVDVTSQRDVRAALSQHKERFGPVSVLVSNAGISRHGTVHEISVQDYDAVMDTNVRGLLNTSAAVVPMMKESANGGAIIAVSSIHAQATSNDLPAYAASKAAVLGMCRAMALDYGPDQVRVNAILPGAVATPMLQASARRHSPDDPGSSIKEWGERQPLGRVVDPEEVATVIAFLASSWASAITGVSLPVDAGLLARLAL